MSAIPWLESPWQLLGWIGLGCFFSRFLIQWIASERARASVTPPLFWWISVAGSLLLIAYSLYRGEPIFLAGYLVTLAIYLRNLWIESHRASRLGPFRVTGMAIAAWALLVGVGMVDLRPGYGDSMLWLAIGAGGQALWSSRFIVQWLLSEREGRSHFPAAFWWVSLAGNALLLAYAAYLRDPIWIVGLCLGPAVQIRNLMIMRRAAS